MTTPSNVVGDSFEAFLIPPYPTIATPITIAMMPVQCYQKYYFFKKIIDKIAVAATTDPFII